MLSTISKKSKTSSSFTLVELLVVLAIIAVLATVIVLVINPAELLKQFRDASRINDLASINRALNYVLTDCPTCFFGSSSIVYVSIPDSSPTCANLGLPSLPSGWSYACSDSNNYRKVNGAGWIPVDFTKFSAGSPLSKLPVDPINTTSTGQYYTYVTGGSWALSSLFESQKYLKDKALTDGGYNPAKYETGSNLKLIAQSEGLVGWWSFDEGSGTIAKDQSGNNNNGTLYNGPTWTQGKVGGALSFDGVNDYVDCGDKSDFILSNKGTVSVWVYVPQTWTGGAFPNIISKGASAGWDTNGWSVFAFLDDRIGVGHRNSSNVKTTYFYNTLKEQWFFIVGVWDGLQIKIYQNETMKDAITQTFSLPTTTVPLLIGKDPASQYFGGKIDEVRIYNRALSAAEIKAIYNATK